MILFLVVLVLFLVLIYLVIVCREIGIFLYWDLIGYILKSFFFKVFGILIWV